MYDKIICLDCSTKSGRADSSGLYKDFVNGLWRFVCLKCGWATEPFHHHEDLKYPTKEELKKEWR